MPKIFVVLLVSLCVALPSRPSCAATDGCTPWWSKFSLRFLLGATVLLMVGAGIYGNKMRRRQAFERWRAKLKGPPKPRDEIAWRAATNAWANTGVWTHQQSFEILQKIVEKNETLRKINETEPIDWDALNKLWRRVDEVRKENASPETEKKLDNIFLGADEDIFRLARFYERVFESEQKRAGFTPEEVARELETLKTIESLDMIQGYAYAGKDVDLFFAHLKRQQNVSDETLRLGIKDYIEEKLAQDLSYRYWISNDAEAWKRAMKALEPAYDPNRKKLEEDRRVFRIVIEKIRNEMEDEQPSRGVVFFDTVFNELVERGKRVEKKDE